MTVQQVRDILKDCFPRLQISVSETAFYHGLVADESPYTEFVISISPGFDGHDNQNFGANSLENCLKKLILAQSTPIRKYGTTK